MDLAGVDRDHVAGAGFHHAATAQRFLGALVDEADAELLMRVAGKHVARRRLDGLDAADAARGIS